MKLGSQGAEPITKGLLSIEMLLALLCTALFAVTLIRPWEEKQLVTAGKDGHAPGVDPAVLSPQILSDVQAMLPMQLVAHGDTQQAVDRANEMLTTDPYKVQTLMCAGDVYIAAGKTDEGLKYLRKAAYLAPQSRYVRFNYAQQLKKSKHYDEAIEEEEFLNKNAGDAKWNELHDDLGDLYAKTGKYKEAAEQVKIVLKSDPDNATAHENLGLYTALTGDIKGGYSEFVKGVELARTRKSLPQPVSQAIKERGGSADSAIQSLHRQVGINPQDNASKVLLARILLYQGRMREAADTLKDAAAANSPNSDAHLVMAQVMKLGGNDEAALDHFQQAVKYTGK